MNYVVPRKRQFEQVHAAKQDLVQKPCCSNYLTPVRSWIHEPGHAIRSRSVLCRGHARISLDSQFRQLHDFQNFHFTKERE